MASERALLLSQRSLVGTIDTLGILAIATFVPLAVRDHLDVRIALVWSAVIALTTLGWSVRLPWVGDRSAVAAVWLSGVAWAALPWLAWSALDDATVVWMLVAICGYGLATDALLLPQTFKLNAYSLMFFYVVSYVVAFAMQGHWVPLTGLIIFALHLAGGMWGFEQIKHGFLRNVEETEAEAYRDPLTGLASRGAAIREISRRLDSGDRVHCIVADVDDFKAINTHLGHHGGDAALVALADALTMRLKGWYVARLGGDEFLAVHRRGLHPSEEGLLTSINVGEVGEGRGPQILSLSLGGTSSTRDSTPDQLLTEASAALRRAKALGKQRMIVADDLLRDDESQRERLAGRAQLALRNAEIIAWGQPIFDLGTGRPAGVELLARWPQRDGTMELPGDFVPIIEAQGLGSPLADRMIRYAISVLQQLTTQGDTTSFVSVNLSALVLLERELPERLAQRLARAEIAPSRLVIEMTESQQLPNTEMARIAFERIRATGVGIASDDLGAGWSSINQLLRTAFTHVKIDRDVMTSTRPGSAELLSALRLLAEGAGQTPIAEGLETSVDLERARTAGFRLGQGWLLARPEPIDDVLRRFSTPELILDLSLESDLAE